MKIKTVCERTGLTDRAIRFYIDEGLLKPACTESYWGRKSLDFGEEDVKVLSDIAVLRKFGFSVEQIRAIMNTPEESRFVVESMRQQKQDIVDAEQEILTVLHRLDNRQDYSLSALAAALQENAAKQPLPKDDSVKQNGFIGFLMGVLWFLGMGIGFVAAIAVIFLVTDMVIVYLGHGGFEFTVAGLQKMSERIAPYVIDVSIVVGLGIMLFYFAEMCWKYARNDRKPEVTVHAVVTDKKMNADGVVLNSFYHRDGGMVTFLVFRTDDGNMLQLTVPGSTYYLVNIGTRGQLVYQGTKLVKFTPDRSKKK